MIKFEQLFTEGVYDPNIFKAIFLAGGPGSGKSYVAGKTILDTAMGKMVEFKTDQKELF